MLAEHDTTTPEDTPALWDGERLHNPHRVEDKPWRVRRMFDAIAPTYQRVNSVASAGRDRAWRRAVVRMAGVGPDDRVLDIACGTGDLADTFRGGGAQRIVGLDFSRQMLARWHRPADVGCCQGDALSLPIADTSVDITSCAFGVRNFASPRRGFAEMYRVLRPGGRAMILEFAMPRGPIIGRMYRFYFHRVLPRLARWISKDRSGAYDYLPNSVQSFDGPAELEATMLEVGFSKVTVKRMTCGIVYILRGDK